MKVGDKTTPDVPAGEGAESGAGEGRPDKAARKLRRKEKKLLRDTERRLDSWERYRALTDALAEATDLVDLADHKARFALLIMGAVNAALVVLATQTGALRNACPTQLRTPAVTLLGLYALVVLYFLLQAIEAIRPRVAQPRGAPAGGGGEGEGPLGLRFYADVLTHEQEAYPRAWRSARIGQLTTELALQVYGVSGILEAKLTALRRLYSGLKFMTVVVALVLIVAASRLFLTG